MRKKRRRGTPEAERVGEAAYEEKHKAEVKGTISLEEAIAIAKKKFPARWSRPSTREAAMKSRF